MSASEPRLNEFQREVLDALSSLATDLGCRFEIVHVDRATDNSVWCDIGIVPLEVAPERVSIASPYNAREFDRQDYEETSTLILDLSKIVTDYSNDPTQMKHPVVRMWVRLFGGNPT